MSPATWTPTPLVSSADFLKLWPQSKDEIVTGKHICLEPLKERHADDLFPSVGGEAHAHLWDYMPRGPFLDLSDFQSYIRDCANSKDVSFWAIRDRKTDKIVGHISLLRIDPSNATVEIGHIMYSPLLQRTVAASEAWFLLAQRAFNCGFRRLEWKCNARNEPSRRAALRFGHEFEGVFRQHMIVKGKNRDTAWYAILDGDWPRVERAMLAWMDDSNFDEDGRQLEGLMSIRKKLASC
jgi:RimJ/RimL family protein N-acetyltransferase